jgi:hypothetical protein
LGPSIVATIAQQPKKSPPVACKFQSELALVRALKKYLTRTGEGRYRIFMEHEGGFGRPDLLLYSMSPNARLDIRALADLNPRLAPLLSVSAAESISTYGALAAAMGVSEPDARKVARMLQRLGRLQIEGATIKLEPIRAFPFQEIVAIEAKLRDWRRALTQAYRYRHFSSEAWVLLDHGSISAALSRLDQFKATGIGLASFSLAGDLYVHISALNQPLQNEPLAWRTQAMLARVP